jgi:hypothetical protein
MKHCRQRCCLQGQAFSRQGQDDRQKYEFKTNHRVLVYLIRGRLSSHLFDFRPGDFGGFVVDALNVLLVKTPKHT